MEVDEGNTLARLKGMRADLIDPKIAAHNGRIVKLMGDGALVEFPSVVHAVACAVEIQREIAEHNADLPGDMHLTLRIGVNLGDVIVEGADIYGDGVNVVARLETLADPGGVLISGTAFDQVEGKSDCGFEFLGERQVKNIERPVRLYRARLHTHSPARPAVAKGRRYFARWPTIAAAVVAIALTAGVAAWVGLGGVSPPQISVAS